MKYSSTITFENVRALKTVIIYVYAQGGHTEFEILRYIHLTSFISIFFFYRGGREMRTYKIMNFAFQFFNGEVIYTNTSDTEGGRVWYAPRPVSRALQGGGGVGCVPLCKNKIRKIIL